MFTEQKHGFAFPISSFTPQVRLSEFTFVIPSSQIQDQSLKDAGLCPKTAPEIETNGLVTFPPMGQAGLETESQPGT